MSRTQDHPKSSFSKYPYGDKHLKRVNGLAHSGTPLVESPSLGCRRETHAATTEHHQADDDEDEEHEQHEISHVSHARCHVSHQAVASRNGDTATERQLSLKAGGLPLVRRQVREEIRVEWLLETQLQDKVVVLELTGRRSVDWKSPTTVGVESMRLAANNAEYSRGICMNATPDAGIVCVVNALVASNTV